MIGGRGASGTLIRRVRAMVEATRADDAPPELPLFRGVVQVLELLGKLYRRPRLGEHSKPSDHNEASRGLPMLCLVRPSEHDTLLPAIATRLKDAKPHRIPHAFEDLGADELDRNDSVSSPEMDDAPVTRPDVDKVRKLLAKVAEQLNERPNEQAGRLHFPRLRLALWLMEQDLSDEDMPRRDAELRRRIWRRERAQRFSELLSAKSQNAPDATVWSVLGLIAVIPWLVFRIRLSGRVPGLGRKYRWFRRQPYLAPEIRGTFVGFAERLTWTEWVQEEPEQVSKFLTNAFLEDLRAAYGRLPWRLRGARRMTYVPVLLNNVTRTNGGYALLKLINDVRNETGHFDPLLVVSASRKVPPHAVEPTVTHVRDGVYDANKADTGYRAWQQKLAHARRKRNEMTWYLPISTYANDSDDQELSSIKWDLDATPPYTMDRAPWWSWRVVPAAVVISALAGAGVWFYNFNTHHCDNALAQWSMLGSGLGLTSKGSECVGVTDGSHLGTLARSSDKESRKKMQRLGDALAAQNRDAEARSKQERRELVTVAYLGDLSTQTLAAQHETLAGIAVAQRDQNSPQREAPSPLVRVLVANGGKGMGHGSEVAENYLRELSHRDPRFVGVVGLNHSQWHTISTIRTLTNVGLPMVASTLSLDNLYQNSPMYYQVSPQNKDQARQAREFADRNGRHGKVWLYYDDGPNDPYSTNLAEGIKTEFGPDRVTRLNEDTFAAGEQACAANPNTDLVYYAGRGADFNGFLRGVSDGCGNSPEAERPMILAGDDVTQHVASRGSRTDVPGVSYYYQAFAAAPTDPDPDSSSNTLLPNEVTFYCKLHTFIYRVETGHEPTDTCPRRGSEEDLSLDGHSALAHDAMIVLLSAVERLVTNQVRSSEDVVSVPIPITPGSVWKQLSSGPSSANDMELASGNVSFTDPATNQVPYDKQIRILKVVGGEVQPTNHGH